MTKDEPGTITNIVTKDEPGTITNIVTIAIAIGCIPLTLIVSVDLWQWYLVPLGMPSANWAAVWGVILAVHWLRVQGHDPHTTFEGRILKPYAYTSRVIGRLLALLLIWLTGYLLQPYAVIGGAL